VHLNALELLSQPTSPFGLHPVLISVHEIDGSSGFDLVEYVFDAPVGLDRPVEERIETLLTTVALVEDKMHILLPYDLLAL
jgi:hypothetical protein